MNALPAGLHSASLAFANREVLLTRQSARRALAHLENVGDLPVPELKKLAHTSASEAVARFKTALSKRNFEIRQLK